MKALYLELTSLVERLHRHFLEVVKCELDRVGIRDINNVQALILFNIGDEDLTIGELTNRGYYLGSNVSYNVKKLVEHGYLIQQRSQHDRRSVRVHLSNKAKEVVVLLDSMFDGQSEALVEHVLPQEELSMANETLQRVDRFWTRLLDFGLRLPERRTSEAA